MLDERETPISGPNPLCPERMSPQARRQEISRLLATAVVRLAGRDCDDLSKNAGDSSLHFPRKQSGTATPTQRRSA